LDNKSIKKLLNFYREHSGYVGYKEEFKRKVVKSDSTGVTVCRQKMSFFEPRINIEYGTAYLNLLDKNYLSGVHNSVSREYCVISAYNGGAGNVFKTFGSSKSSALDNINSINPPAVFWKLKSDHPFEESRNYVVKVTNAKKEFVNYR